MRIRLLLLTGTAAALAVGSFAFLSGLQVSTQADRYDDAQVLAQTASREASALLALSQDYLLHESPRAARQWHTRQAELARSLQASPGLPDSAQQALDELREVNAGLIDLFRQLEAAPAEPGAVVTLAQRELLADHLVAGTQRIAEGIYQVAEELTDERRTIEQRRRALVRTAAVALLCVLLGLALLIEQRVLRPLRRLRQQTRAVRGGDLATRSDDAANDEFGDLARDFNAMTAALETRTRALQDNERQLRVLTERLPALVAFVDREGRYRFCSAEYQRCFGEPAESFVGRRIGEFSGPAIQRALRPHVAGVLRGETQRFELAMPVRGGVADFLCEYTPEFDARGDVIGFHAMSLDISERRAAERQLVESLAWKRAMLDSAAFAVIAVDEHGVIRLVNPAALRMLQYREDELVGRCTPERFHDPHELAQRAEELAHELGRPVSAVDALCGRTRLGPAEEREWTFVRKDGSRLPVSLTMSAIRDAEGRVTGFLGLATDITERKRTEAMVRHLAHHDVLTQLPNRALLDDRMAMALRRTQRSGERVAAIMLDLDHFKRINDSLGHQTGDRLLQAVAQRLQSAVRPSDTVARMGGDEFVVLLDGIRDSADLERIATAILQRLAEPVLDGAQELRVTTSLGIALYPDDSPDAATLLKHADAAMYAAKSDGRNAWRLFDASMLAQGAARLVMEAALRRAIERDELALHYQPQIDLAHGALVGMEALLRWDSPELGPVSPAEFIALAEESDLILPLGRWVLERACRDAVQIQHALRSPLALAVNLSPRQFGQPDLALQVESALATSGLAASDLELEITEGVFLLDAPRTLETVHALRTLGVALAIDDFGTGYSSLSYLTRYPVDRIKIDQSFVRQLPADPNAAAVATAVVALAHGLGMAVVAEGIETADQRGWLRERGCNIGQGYLYSPALPPQDFIAWARRRLADRPVVANA